MKYVKWTAIALAVTGALIIAAIYVYLQLGKPQMSGSLRLNGLFENAEIVFDSYGIPHIYAANEHDAWMAFGYVHARDRLFQMEMMRRLGAGRLAEVFGSELTRTDAFFRTLGIGEYARRAAARFSSEPHMPCRAAVDAYLQGINAYIGEGNRPVECVLAGLPLQPFTVEDVYLVTGYMAFTFEESLKTDLVLSGVLSRNGPRYLRHIMPGLSLDSIPGHEVQAGETRLRAALFDAPNPVPALLGSNAWAVAPSRSASGKVLLCNDTHIGYAQPSVWYEAHIEYPGYSLYGNFLAGFPFPLVGHTRDYGWGLTMLMNDDLDFYREEIDIQNPGRYRVGDGWKPMRIRREVIKVKNSADSVIAVRSTHHGPLVNEVMYELLADSSRAVSMLWTFTRTRPTALEATFGMCHAANMEEFRNACSLIESPGLNVVYGDTRGNIAWWACGRLLKRSSHTDSRLLLDGPSGADEPQGYYLFHENPHLVNPECGYVVSANSLPAGFDKHQYAGYYAPEIRAQRIEKLLLKKPLLDSADMADIQSDHINEHFANLAKQLAHDLLRQKGKKPASLQQASLTLLEKWDGSHGLHDRGPVLFYKILSKTLALAMLDEMDSAAFSLFSNSHAQKSSLETFLTDGESPWWDDGRTEEVESRMDILNRALEQGIRELRQQLGPEPVNWTWGRVHTVEYVHPIGRQKPLDKVFNIGPFPAPGGTETINKSGFVLSDDGLYRATLGPAMRIVIDFAQVENATSVIPTGQSGQWMSAHYQDQVELYLACGRRPMLMNRTEISRSENKLKLYPIK